MNPDCAAKLARIEAKQESTEQRLASLSKTEESSAEYTRQLADKVASSAVTLASINANLAHISTTLSQHGEMLKALPEIKEQTIKTNGSVIRHEGQIVELNRECRDLQGAKDSARRFDKLTTLGVAVLVSVITAVLVKLVTSLKVSP